MSNLPGLGGAGAEPAGDPMGAGGPLYVVRARAIAGQVIRVVFDEEPLHQGASGNSDALNPSNYQVTIVSGTGQQPLVVGVDETVMAAPAIAVAAGDERAIDIHTDRELVLGLGYRVRVFRVQSLLGYPASGFLAGSATADFPGIVPLHVVTPMARRLENNDLANDAIEGRFRVSNGGDVDLQSGRESFRKRVVRRLVTTKNAFSWLKGYGVGLRLKEELRTNLLQDYKADAIQQIAREPETKKVDVTLQVFDQGMMSVKLGITTKEGAFVEVETQHRPDGTVTFLP